jgi:cell division protein FtsQ
MKWRVIVFGVIKWVIVLSYVILTLSFVGSRNQQIICSGLNINVSDSLQNAFITKEDVKKLIEKHHKNLVGIPISMINTYEIEQYLKNMQSVKMAEVYSNIDGIINIDIKQRKPMVRVINRYNQGYYIDYEGQILPLSSKFTSHVLIVNGNIIEPFEISSNIRIMDWCDERTEDIPLICQLFGFAKHISQDEFWKAQISQVYVESPTRIELIPRVGAHTILLGSLDGYEVKLKKLRLFYETALPEEGWNKYKQINLKYSNQIVCTKK